MKIEIGEEPITTLEEYASIPIAFEVNSILDVRPRGNGLGEFVLTDRPLDIPYVKDYDSINGDEPAQWAMRFDISNWVLFTARAEGRRIGGAVVAFSTPSLIMLEGREDLAVLWDIRVSPEARGQGVGSSLFREAEAWARAKSCRQLKIETQNNNVAACRFYARLGCVLRAVNHMVYAEFPDEVQLLWYKELSDNLPSG
jgi:ribosomal protein S18 acetylase RimI-like enzyme